jgi:hypothetical protein
MDFQCQNTLLKENDVEVLTAKIREEVKVELAAKYEQEKDQIRR